MNSIVARTETRIIRPFIGLEAFEELASRTILKIGNANYSSGTIVLPSHKLKERGFILLPNFNQDELREACKAASIPSSSVHFIVFASSRMLRVSSLIYEFSLDNKGNLQNEIDLEDQISNEYERLIFLDSTGFDLYSAITLSKSSSAKALHPHRVGTWLSKSSFAIKPEVDISSFAPEPLADSIKEQFSLPKDCYSYVYLSETLLQAEDLSEVVTVYLDPEVLNLLLIDENDEISRQMQTTLAIQTIETVVSGIVQALREEGQSISDLESSSGALQFVTQLSSNLKVSLEDLLELSLSNPSYLRPRLESYFKLQSLNEQILKGGR